MDAAQILKPFANEHIPADIEKSAAAEHLSEIITMKTTGDKILDRSLESVGGKGLFVKELDQALADGRIDLAVHSLKDMPMEESSEFPILAYSRREDPRDVLIYKSEKKEQGTEEGSILTKTGAVIGTSSKRRMIQIQKLYPNAVFQGIRGNIQTRLSKLNNCLLYTPPSPRDS